MSIGTEVTEREALEAIVKAWYSGKRSLAVEMCQGYRVLKGTESKAS